MTKYILLALLIGAIGFGLWFLRLSGPQQLDYADRWYPGAAEFKGRAQQGIAYGENDLNRLDVFRPATDGPHPILVFFHGGSWHDGARTEYSFVGRAFAARGFVTVIADYRKSPAVKFPAFVEDAAGAIAWTFKNAAAHGGDPENLFVMGHSAGGHLAILTALDPQWLKRKGLDSSAVKGAIGLAGPYDFLPLDKGSLAEAALGGWPNQGETQPINFVRRDAPPMLLLSGADDVAVHPRNSQKLATAILDIEGSAELKIYPGLDHPGIIMAIARPFRNKATVIEDTIAFINNVKRN